MQFLASKNPALAKTIRATKAIEKYKKCVVPERKKKKAMKVFKKFVGPKSACAEIIPKETMMKIAGEVETFDELDEREDREAAAAAAKSPSPPVAVSGAVASACNPPPS